LSSRLVSLVTLKNVGYWRDVVYFREPASDMRISVSGGLQILKAATTSAVAQTAGGQVWAVSQLSRLCGGAFIRVDAISSTAPAALAGLFAVAFKLASSAFIARNREAPSLLAAVGMLLLCMLLWLLLLRR
jgi:hypothetical protein